MRVQNAFGKMRRICSGKRALKTKAYGKTKKSGENFEMNAYMTFKSLENVGKIRYLKLGGELIVQIGQRRQVRFF